MTQSTLEDGASGDGDAVHLHEAQECQLERERPNRVFIRRGIGGHFDASRAFYSRSSLLRFSAREADVNRRITLFLHRRRVRVHEL